ncbi:hypothetical protein Hanom_Chr10g00939391 [Helianthus anomalus]
MIIFNQSRSDPNTAKSFDNKNIMYVILPSSKLSFFHSYSSIFLCDHVHVFYTRLLLINLHL